jgi:hypothetical protein
MAAVAAPLIALQRNDPLGRAAVYAGPAAPKQVV